jgi:hypothetical protein
VYIYLDESGDVGFDFVRGSSRYFVIALVLVDDPIPLHEAINTLRTHLGMPREREFKFYSTSDDARLQFFQAVRTYPFKVRCLVVDKKQLRSSHLRSKEPFYSYLIKMLLKYDSGTIRGAKLVIDESFKGKRHKNNLGSYLKRELNSQAKVKIDKVMYHTSHSDNLIQLADMVVGAIARRYERGDGQYHQLIRKKIDDEWCFK